MSVVSGRGGNMSLAGTAVSSVRNWKINHSANNGKGVASNTGNMQVQTTGNTDWTLSYDFYGKEMPALPGTTYAFIGYNGSERASGSVLVTQMNLTCDIAGGNILGGTIQAGANGALTLATGSAVSDSSVPTMYSPIGAKASWQPIIAGTPGSAADVPDVQQWGLTINCQDFPYVSSSTSGVTQRTAGNYSASATVDFLQASTAYVSASGTRLLPGTPGILKLYVDSSLFFGLTYAIVASVQELGPDIEGGGQNKLRVAFDFTGFTNISGTMTRGSLVRPDTTAFWS